MKTSLLFVLAFVALAYAQDAVADELENEGLLSVNVGNLIDLDIGRPSKGLIRKKRFLIGNIVGSVLGKPKPQPQPNPVPEIKPPTLPLPQPEIEQEAETITEDPLFEQQQEEDKIVGIQLEDNKKEENKKDENKGLLNLDVGGLISINVGK